MTGGLAAVALLSGCCLYRYAERGVNRLAFLASALFRDKPFFLGGRGWAAKKGVVSFAGELADLLSLQAAGVGGRRGWPSLRVVQQ